MSYLQIFICKGNHAHRKLHNLQSLEINILIFNRIIALISNNATFI